MRSRLFGGRFPRILVLLLLLGLARRLFFSGDGGGGAGGGNGAVLPGVDGATLVAVAVVVLAIGGVLAYRAGTFPWGARSESLTERPDGDYTCRYCGENLDHYRSRCPYCETRNPVGDPESDA
ncbi:hypothetical protein [Haladaptatus salinisoli]|uniref:hypothetical protein n=1 Tax=Haladaptatus salinisoli TaxID=2884876 RepID=UPI001D0A2678|nr:hypothetical protein [Haladaptatus salinisoli]